MKKFLTLFVALVLLAPLAFTQSRETGAIRGLITDDQGGPIPGVNVTLSSDSLMGLRTFVTDAAGEYRFPALPPGVYKVKAELQGFGAVIRENIRVSTTITLDVDFQLKPASVTEEVNVVAKAPTVDVKSTETASVTLANEVLRTSPITSSPRTSSTGPRRHQQRRLRRQPGHRHAYSMDGVNVADPDAGQAWVFSDHNIIEEAKVMGIGLPAEYGNFTGVIFNLVTNPAGTA